MKENVAGPSVLLITRGSARFAVSEKVDCKPGLAGEGNYGIRDYKIASLWPKRKQEMKKNNEIVINNCEQKRQEC